MSFGNSEGDINLDIRIPIKQRPPNFIRGSALALPFRDKSVSVVRSSHVLEHTPDPYVAIQESLRVGDKVRHVLPIGFWAYVHPNHYWFYRKGQIRRIPFIFRWISYPFLLNRYLLWFMRKVVGHVRGAALVNKILTKKP